MELFRKLAEKLLHEKPPLGGRVRTAQLAVLCGTVLLALTLACGCRSTRVEHATHPLSWTDLGVTLTLPPGTWTTEPLPDKTGILFSPETGGHFLFMRVESSRREPAWIALRKLFIEFNEKKEIRRWQVKAPSGEVGECAEYAVKTSGLETLVRACVIAHRNWKYELIGWDLPDPALIDTVLGGMKFLEPANPARGTP